MGYRSLKFEHEKLDIEDYQGNALVNYTEEHIPYTRIIEHKHFENVNVRSTIITKEMPDSWSIEKEKYYPINNDVNNKLYETYNNLTKKEIDHSLNIDTLSLWLGSTYNIHISIYIKWQPYRLPYG